jgi:hypothetical protein
MYLGTAGACTLLAAERRRVGGGGHRGGAPLPPAPRGFRFCFVSPNLSSFF